MFIIRCPWCGDRDQSEFSCHGEAHIARPPKPEKLSESQWGDYLFFRNNPKGIHFERWMHSHGCRRWFNVARDTRTDHIYASYKVGESPKRPKITAADSASRTTSRKGKKS